MNKLRTKVITFRVTEKEFKYIKRLAKNVKVTVADIVRWRCLPPNNLEVHDGKR